MGFLFCFILFPVYILGINRLVDVVEMSPIPKLSLDQQEQTTAAVFNLKQKIVLQYYLHKNDLSKTMPR